MIKNVIAPAAVVLSLSVAPTAAQPLTQQERDTLVKHLEQTRQAFLDSIEGLSDAQWAYKAGPDRWSIAEVAEHIAVSESVILQLVTEKIMKGPATPPNPSPMPDEKLVAALLDRSGKFQAPEFLKPTNRWPTRDALVKGFTEARDKTMTYAKTTADDLHGHGAPHPVFKTLDGYQWLLLISGHSARHTAQINEVKESPGYPKA